MTQPFQGNTGFVSYKLGIPNNQYQTQPGMGMAPQNNFGLNQYSLNTDTSEQELSGKLDNFYHSNKYILIEKALNHMIVFLLPQFMILFRKITINPRLGNP